MEKNKSPEPETDSELLSNVFEFLSETDHLSQEEIQRALKEEGIDPKEMIQRGLEFIEVQRAAATQRMLEEAKVKKNVILDHLNPKTSVPGKLEELRDKVIEKWSALGVQASAPLALAFRNLDSATEEDLRSLLADIDRLSELAEKRDKDCP